MIQAGDGSESKPYATLDKIADPGIIQTGKSYAISLSNGDYTLSTKMFNLTNDKVINIYGNKENTRLLVGTLYGNNSSGGLTSYSISFNRLVWQSSGAMYYNPIDIKTQMTFNNVVFNITETHGYSYFSACGNIYMYNCVSLNANMILRKNGYQIKLTNCYGNFTTGYSTSVSDWNYQTNYITTTPNLSSIYEILDNINVWKNVGTGTNSDGTQSNLGVYGGPYTWSD